ncbi:type VI secretion system tube protein Hcp, partial [Escherichia coli]
WWRTSVEGKQEHYFTTRLTDATIVDMNLHMPHCQDPAQREFTQLLAVSLAYRKVECKRLVRTVLIFTESSDQLSRATDRVP